MTDILVAIGLTASAAVTVALIVGSFPGSAQSRTTLALGLMAWFGLIVVLGVTGALDARHLGTAGVGVFVLAPVAILAYLAPRVALLQRVLLGTPVPSFVLVHVGRILGIAFLVLYADGRLSAPFAPIAGWGDIAIACSAVPVAWLLALRPTTGNRRVALVWNTLGFLDLLIAVGLGVTSAPDSPVQIFTRAPGTAQMTDLPMLIVPVFLVPLYLLSHLAIFYRLLRQPGTVEERGDARGLSNSTAS